MYTTQNCVNTNVNKMYVQRSNETLPQEIRDTLDYDLI